MNETLQEGLWQPSMGMKIVQARAWPSVTCPVNSINQSIFMDPSEYPIVFCIKNDTASDLHLHLEMIPEDVILSPSHSVELLARPTEGLLPITIDCVDGGLQIHACREFDPDWYVRFNGKLIKAGNPTHLKDYE